MSKSQEFTRLSVYLRSRANGKFTMTPAQVAKELLLSKAAVSVLLGSGELKSCHVDDVAKYIIRKDSENGKD